MPRKIVIDCDPGIDDAVALCMALFDPRIEVVAVTAAAGNTTPTQSSRNVQAVIEMLDPPRWPRIGVARSEDPLDVEPVALHGPDGLGNLGVRISELHHQHPSDKVITDAIRNEPGKISVLTLGPLTNLARALGRDPELATLIDRLIMVGGSTAGVGNVAAGAEFNMYADPQAARLVFQAPVTKTLIPLEVTSRAMFSLDFLDKLPDENTRAGDLLRRMLPYAFRAYRQQLGRETIFLHDAVGLLAVLQPELFETEEMAGDVEVRGELTRGFTVFDRRLPRQWRLNMEVAKSIDKTEAIAAVLRGLKFAGQESEMQ